MKPGAHGRSERAMGNRAVVRDGASSKRGLYALLTGC
jgi:hypothetical protein